LVKVIVFLQILSSSIYHILNIRVILKTLEMNNLIKVTNQGTINIPSKIRRKLNISDGREYFIVQDFCGAIMLIPYIDIENEENRIENSIIDKILNNMEKEQ